MPMASTTRTAFVVGNLQQSVVYIFEVSLGRSGPHSYPINAQPKTGVCTRTLRIG